MLTVVFCPCHNDVTFKIKLESTYFLFSYEKQTKSKVLQKCRKDCLTPGANTDTLPMHHIQHVQTILQRDPQPHFSHKALIELNKYICIFMYNFFWNISHVCMR